LVVEFEQLPPAKYADFHVSLCQAKSTGNPGALRRARVATISGFTARK
jgi:hypothetical protein